MFGEGVPELAGEFVAQQAGVGEVRDRGFLRHCAVFEYSHAIGHAQRQLDVVRDQQHAAARVREGAEVVERANGQVKVQTRRWLIRYDHARVVHERAAQKHATSHTARQLVRIQARHLGAQPVTLEQLLPTRAALGLRQPVREPFHLLAHAHHGVKVAHALRHQRQPVPA